MDLKIDYLRKKLRIAQKVRFSQQVGKVANPEENFDLMETTFFLFKALKNDK